MTKSLFYLSFTLSLSCFSFSAFAPSAQAHTSHTASSAKNEQQKAAPSTSTLPQLEIYEASQDKNRDYLIALYTHQSGAALISYNTPTCQANSHGTTRPDAKDPSKLEFTAREDPYCKITLQKTRNHQLKVLKETLPCATWHGDFCSFKSLAPLTRIYPASISQKN